MRVKSPTCNSLQHSRFSPSYLPEKRKFLTGSFPTVSLRMIFYSLTLGRKQPVLLGLQNRRKEKENFCTVQIISVKIYARQGIFKQASGQLSFY